MPNVKIYVDDTLLPDGRAALIAALDPLRLMLCTGLNVPATACQFAVLPVIGISDQPAVNVELHLLPQPGRTRARLTEVAAQVQALLAAATAAHTAVRIAQLNPETYIALK